MTYGTVNVDSVVNSDGVTSGGLYGFKNRIINGAMMIDQRNAGASITPSTGTYSVDRWRGYSSQASKFTLQQTPSTTETGYATRVAAGFLNYLAAVSSATTSLGATDLYLIQQFVEGFNTADLSWGTANAQPITLSFWVRSSLTGMFGANIQNEAGDRSYPFSYTINSANTWEYKTVTIPGSTSGTWATTTGKGVVLSFSLGSGSTVSGTAGAWTTTSSIYGVTGSTSVVGTNGATFYITGVQLEKGSTATSFDYRPYGTELALCQRYCYVITTAASQVPLCMSANYSTTNQYGVVSFPVTMRSAPTATFVNAANWNLTGSGAATPTTLAQGQATQYATEYYGTTVTGLTVGAAGWFRSTSSSTNKIINSAEL